MKHAIEIRKRIMSLADMGQRKEAHGSLTDAKKKLDAERAENVANKSIIGRPSFRRPSFAHRHQRGKSTSVRNYVMIWIQLMSKISQPERQKMRLARKYRAQRCPLNTSHCEKLLLRSTL